MTMTSRERMLTALANGRPDRLPCQVHGWTPYYLNTYLGGCDWFEAYARFGMDYAIYTGPAYHFDERDLANWRVERIEHPVDADGNHPWEETIVTPKGTLRQRGAYNDITPWITEHPIKNERDFALWDEFVPVASRVDFSPVAREKEKLGDRGILRVHPPSFGQGSPWQSFCYLYGTEEAIFLGMDEPATLHHYLDAMSRKTERVLEQWLGQPADMIETGGGAGSNTVISPAFFREFCLPYDQRQNRLLHAAGLKIVYHLCGGVMQMLDLVVETGADGLETMTPPSMGGDCDLAAASRRVGDRLFFIGGFDQNAGFERGSPARARDLVRACFAATRDHAGYICCPSDHFFHGDPANIQAFADAARECVY